MSLTECTRNQPTVTEARILRELIDKPYATTNDLANAVYCDREDGGPDTAESLIKKFVAGLRPKLRTPFCIVYSAPYWRLVP